MANLTHYLGLSLKFGEHIHFLLTLSVITAHFVERAM